ncbi:low molecular weight protein tyrosine phosphatase family protein [Luteibacter aegosomatis]|uniref:low molecular weight protein tyrosine phosphatase family protein n=1 Tax=Luteibacter aegosomatis TaxID=2911537 RepID=UPI001FF99D40|nr:low molecular weight protein tyrosine phosphatase family protein [Luteibacter aegosomatis]UPG87167.1 low molecular weight protein tyrosine phosphatase family protein [Luteibacter aegosomatis]
MIRVLFLCGKNRLRSPTAEQVFATWPGIETDSAGIDRDAECPVTSEQVRWADRIVAMEKSHLAKLRRGFRADLGRARLLCVDIPDDYAYMQPELIALLEQRVGPQLRR